MSKAKKSEPTETGLISWAVPRIAQGHYAVSDSASGRELWVTERQPDLDEMEGELLYNRPEEVKQEILALRRDCSREKVRKVFALLLGNKIGDSLAEQLNDAFLRYELIIALAYDQEKRLVKDVQSLLTKERERISTPSFASMESKMLPDAVSVATVAHYAQEVANLFPRLIHRAESLGKLGTAGTFPGFSVRPCRRLGQIPKARASYEKALALARQEPGRRFLARRLRELK